MHEKGDRGGGQERVAVQAESLTGPAIEPEEEQPGDEEVPDEVEEVDRLDEVRHVQEGALERALTPNVCPSLQRLDVPGVRDRGRPVGVEHATHRLVRLNRADGDRDLREPVPAPRHRPHSRDASVASVRVAAVDLGTNSTRLLVADVSGQRLDEVARRLTITRLGEGVDARRRLLPLPIARVRNCLTDYRRELESLGAERTLAVATSAVRDAENGEAFLGEIEWSYGFATRLLSGGEEARLTFAGVSAGRSLEADTLIFDVGGGSTELIADEDAHLSLDIGCVRSTERFLRSDPPTPIELDTLAEEVRDLLDASTDFSVAIAIGVAGTVSALAGLDLGLTEWDPDAIHGHRMTAAAVERELERLAALPLAERREVPGLEPGRAPVIVAGALIVREVLRHFGLDELEASEHDLLHGAALEASRL